MLDFLKTEGKFDLIKVLTYGVIFAVGGLVGNFTNSPDLPDVRHPAAFEALSEIPPRIIEAERGPAGSAYRIFVDQATGRQIFYYGGALVVLPEPPSLEDLANPFSQ
jgi:hypothetical protein